MTKSPESAIPWPNKFMATATPNAGSPTRTATGSKTAPIRATAGEGQKNQEITIIKIPIVQYARAGVLINLANGEIIASFIPVTVSVLLMPTMIEMTRMVDKSSVMAKVKLLKMLLIEPLSDPVATSASRKMPPMDTKVVSLLITMNPMIKKMNAT